MMDKDGQREELLYKELEELKAKYERPWIKCHSGHVNNLPLALWDCPMCTQELRDKLKALELRNPCEKHEDVEANDYCPICLVNQRDIYHRWVVDLRGAIALLNLMIDSRESHTETSKQVIEDALEIPEELRGE